MQKGDVVFDKAEPRHLGIVRAVCINRRTATVRWIDSQWLSCRVRWADLKLAPVERLKQQIRKR